MHDPMALITDYLLGVFAIVFAVRLWRVHRLWSVAFLFTALGAFLGGTYHAFAPDNAVLWKATVFSVALASFFLLAGGGQGLAILAVIKLVIYMTWMTTHDDFLFVIIDYGLTLLILGIVHIIWRTPATKWVLGSIGMSVLGALVQQFRVSIHPQWFDFNDVYHVIQMVALWMLYRAGLTKRSS